MKNYIYLNMLLAFVLPLGVRAQNGQVYAEEKTYQAPTDPLVLKNISAWQDRKFGLFMHWGTYSILGVVESWTLAPEDVSWTKRTGPHSGNYFEYKKAYENLQTQFNPVKFDPDKWAAAAREGGMQYVVFTTKHHDGFCMFDTKYTDYKITSPNTPFSANPKADVTKAIFESFRKKEFLIGAYFSKPDWHSEDYWWSYFPPHSREETYDRNKYPERWKRFSDFTFNQVQELMTNYGKVDLLWLDGDWARLDFKPIADMAHQKQPGIILIDRHGKPEFVNYLTPEQEVPQHFIPYPWETCMTMGNSWSYIPNENYKPARQLLQTLIDVVAKNGNLLLDIGPGPDGEWHQEAYDRLAEMGAWLKVNGAAIYGTRPFAPYREGPWACTQKGAIRYLTYLPKADEKILPPELKLPLIAPFKTVSLLDGGQRLKVNMNGDIVTLEIPKKLRDKMAGQPAWVFEIK